MVLYRRDCQNRTDDLPVNRASWIGACVFTYWFVPIPKKSNEIIPSVERRDAFFCVALASFVSLPLFVDLEVIGDIESRAFTAKTLPSLEIHFSSRSSQAGWLDMLGIAQDVNSGRKRNGQVAM